MSENTYHLFRHHLKSKRKQLGLSLQELSKRSGVSKSLISKIERNDIQPSIKTASNIAEGLGLPLSEMFRKRVQQQVILHLADEQFVLNLGKHHTKKKVSPITNDLCVEIYHERLNAGAITDSMSHEDASKFILAMTDGLFVTTNEAKYTLKKGDSLYIADNVTHSIQNKGDSQANFITMMHRL